MVIGPTLGLKMRHLFTARIFKLVVLILTCWLQSAYSVSLLDVYRGWDGLDVVEHITIVVQTYEVSQQVSSVFECMRLCWLFKACTALSFSLDQKWCSLYDKKYTGVNSNEISGLRLSADANSIVVGMGRATFMKSKLGGFLKNRGCDNRPCKKTHMCAPVRSNYEYVCIPLASAYCSSNPPTVANSENHPDGIVSVVYTCAPHHFPSGTTHTSVCDRRSKRWSPVDVTCTLVDCNAPPSVQGATSNPLSTLYGETVTYKCLDGGVSASETMSVTCQSNAQWSESPQACVFVSCGLPPTVPNTIPKVLKRADDNTFPSKSIVDLAIAVGGMVQFHCIPGYISPSGTSFLSECQADGTWSSTDHVLCARLDCGEPPFLANSYRQGVPFSASSQSTTEAPSNDTSLESTSAPLTTKFESLVYYSCSYGFSFGSPACPTQGTYNPLLTLTCNVNGTWDTAPGTPSNLDYTAGCLPVDCGHS